MIASLLLPLLLQSADPLPECNQEEADRGIQPAMNQCARRDYLIADTELNAQWKITVAAMKERDIEVGEDLGPLNPVTPSEDAAARIAYKGHFTTLLEGQRAWLAYRDAQCRLEGYQFLGGSAQPMIVSGCLATLTRQRTQELRDLAEIPD